MSLSRLLSLFCHWMLLILPSVCFVDVPLVRYRAATRTTWTRAFAENDNNKDRDDIMDLTGFNPFQYQTRGNRDMSGGTRISLRKTKMQQLVARLLNAGSDDQDVPPILVEHQDFLLEPLEDDDAVLDDPDSIYKGEMDRSQRYQAYKNAMQERLSTARDPKVSKVLQAMRDFVVSFE